MIRDLIQNKFTGGLTTAPAISGVSTHTKQQSTVDLRSIMSDRGDPKKNFEKLRLMLPKVHFPQHFNEQE